jgi:hypothetical protein
MKKMIYTLFFTLIAFASSFAQTGKLEVGMKASAWMLPDATKRNTAWIPGQEKFYRSIMLIPMNRT